MINDKPMPPKWAHRLFRWYCNPNLLDHIEGDLLEVYLERVELLGKHRADLAFIRDVILLFRPKIIRRVQSHKTSNTNMYRNHIKVGWRNLQKNKSYTTINVLGLALSMACCIIIFSFVKHNLTFDNFHHNSDRIYRVVTELHREDIAYRNCVPSSLGGFVRNDFDWAEKVARTWKFSDMLITIKSGNALQKYNERSHLAFTESQFFQIFNLPMAKGEDPETSLIRPNTAIMTERIAKKYFGEDDPIGKTFWLDNKFPFVVTGISKNIPSNSDINIEIFVSYPTLKAYDPGFADELNGWNGIRDGMQCHILLAKNASVKRAEELMGPYVKRFRPTSKNVHQYKLQPLSEVHFDAKYGGAVEKKNLWVLSIIGLFLVITACVNFINLATAMALKRSKEVGVRKVLGSMRQQLLWQFILETAIITSIGMLIAIALSYTLLPYINNFFGMQVTLNPFSDPYLMAFLFGLGLFVTLCAGYYPGLVLARFQPIAALKGKLSSQSIGGFNTRRLLIVFQFAISQVLVIGMVVIIRQMNYAKQSDLGFSKDAIVIVDIGMDSTKTLTRVLSNEISRIPGVDKLSMCFAPPASEHDWGNSIRFDNSDEEVNFRTSIKSADANYSSVFDLEFVAGRNMTPSDTVREILINETLVQKLGLKSNEEALGRVIAANGGTIKAPVVGVLRDFHDKSFHEKISAVLITSWSNEYNHYAIKMNMADARNTLSAIESIWLEHHPDQIFNYQFLDESIASFYASEASMLKMVQTFSFISILIGCLGLYGLVSFMSAQKNKEIGIRKVLGGRIVDIVWIFTREFGALILIAFAIAAPIGWWAMSHWLQAFEFRIDISAWIFLLSISFTVMIAAVTVGYQVMRAALKNPVEALRIE